MHKIKIGTRMVGAGEPCFIIAEAGVNHNGDVDIAKRLIDAAAEAGADAIKFQTFKAESLVSKDADKAEYQKETTGEGSQFDMIKKLELTEDDFKNLCSYASEKGLIFLSTPFDKLSADLLASLDIPAFKIASGEITNYPLLKHISKKGKPMIISTGMATMDEIRAAISLVIENGIEQIVILHCITSYPAKMDIMNLKLISTFIESFDHPIGFSDHSEGIIAPIAATALGVCVVEKHFTLDKAMEGPDHKASLEPDELKKMINGVRGIESAMGTGIKTISPEEENIKKVARKSIVAISDIPEGGILSEDNLDILRPGTGVEPVHWSKVTKMRAKQPIKKGEMISWNMIE